MYWYPECTLASSIHFITSSTYLTIESWTERMTTPRMMRTPPVEVTRSGMVPVIRLWTQKAMTSSRHRRPATRLGEISWRDKVRVVKATSPERDKPYKVFRRNLMDGGWFF